MLKMPLNPDQPSILFYSSLHRLIRIEMWCEWLWVGRVHYGTKIIRVMCAKVKKMSASVKCRQLCRLCVWHF